MACALDICAQDWPGGELQVRGRIADETVTEIRQRTDIVEVIGRFVQLKRSGANFKGLCPFHEEKTPSFNVSPSKQFFHCFGCQEHGDVITFLMRIEGRSFVEVVEDLGQRAGIDVPRERLSPAQAEAAKQRRSERQLLVELNARAAQYYERCLAAPHGAVAQEYLRNRGISEQNCGKFQLGFAPRSGSHLVQTLREHGIDLPLAARAGLIAPRTTGKGYHDRFWNRMICPLHSVSGEVIGFSGRTLDEKPQGPKYVNTPETPVFRKGDALYGLHVASASIRKLGVAVLVEGNFDVLQLHEHGFTNAVAPLGTALTSNQVQLLKRFADSVVAVFDGDAAGQAAATKAAKTLIEGGVEARIASLPAGADPDSLIVADGPGRFQRILEGATPAMDHIIEVALAQVDDTIPGRARALEEIAPWIALQQSATARALYVDRVSMRLGIQRVVVERGVAVAKNANARGGRQAPLATAAVTAGALKRSDSSRPTQASDRAGEYEQFYVELLKMLFAHPHLVARSEKAHITDLIRDDAWKAVYEKTVALQCETGTVDLVRLLSESPKRVCDAVANAAMATDYASGGDPTRALDDCVASIAAARIDAMFKLLKLRIQQLSAGGTRDDEKAREAIKYLDALTKIKMRIRKAREDHEAESLWELVPQIVQVEHEIHET